MKSAMQRRSLAAVLRRILVLLRARLAAQREGSALPVAPLLMLGFVSGLVCALVRDVTPPFAYGLVALSVAAALIAVPLLGDLGALLSADETGDWVRALPVRGLEIHMARALHLLIALAVLSTGVLAPAVAFAPSEFDLVMRAKLFFAGQGQAIALAAALLVAQTILRGRAHAFLVALQTALFVLVLVGSVVGLELVPHMRDWTRPDAVANSSFYPPAWFAAPLASGEMSALWRFAPIAASALALAAVLGVPAPPLSAANAGSTLLGALLTPLRRLLARFWVRGRERASYEWVFDALPKEREFVLRAYPLLAVPLGFLVLGAQGETQAPKESLLALLLFIPGAYAPLLAAHTPGSNSHRARWILDTAPITRGEIENGVLKAVVARFVAPLYFVLVALGCLQGHWELTLRLAVPAFLCCVIALRATWRTFVVDAPLSTPHEQIYINNDWLGALAVVAVLLLLFALGATRYLTTWPASAVAIVALLAFERLLDRRMARGELQPVA
jgi:hypothetical protein